jgi:hypothetical protein
VCGGREELNSGSVGGQQGVFCWSKLEGVFVRSRGRLDEDCSTGGRNGCTNEGRTGGGGEREIGALTLSAERRWAREEGESWSGVERCRTRSRNLSEKHRRRRGRRSRCHRPLICIEQVHLKKYLLI